MKRQHFGRVRQFDHGAVVALYETGRTAVEVADMIGCRPGTVRVIIRDEAPHLLGRKSGKAVDYAAAAALFRNGTHDIAALANLFDVQEETMRKNLEREGIDLPPRVKRIGHRIDLDEAVADYAAGASIDEIGEKQGLHPSGVYRMIKKYAPHLPRQSRGRKRPSYYPKIAQRYLEGVEPAALAVEFKVKVSTVHNALKVQGVEKRSQRRTRTIDYAAVAARFREGATAQSLTTEFGVTISTIYKALKTEGVPRRWMNRARKPRPARRIAPAGGARRRRSQPPPVRDRALVRDMGEIRQLLQKGSPPQSVARIFPSIKPDLLWSLIAEVTAELQAEAPHGG